MYVVVKFTLNASWILIINNVGKKQVNSDKIYLKNEKDDFGRIAFKMEVKLTDFMSNDFN